MIRRRAFLLPVALAVLFILMTMGATLMMQGQLTHTIVIGERQRLIDLIAAQQMEAIVGQELDSQKVDTSRRLVSGDNMEATVTWSSSESVYLKPNTAYATFANVFPGFKDDAWGSGEPKPGSSPPLPRASFRALPASTARVPLSAEHSFVSIDVPEFRENIVYSDLFPYAAYAPGGSVELEQAVSYLNPSYADTVDESSGHGHEAAYPPAQAMTALPVKVLARNKVEVEDFPYGTARSAEGPIEFKEGHVFGRTGPLPPETYVELLRSQILRAMGKSAGDGVLPAVALDKTNLVVGRGITKDNIILDMIKGQFTMATLEKLVSVEQGMFFPLPIIPIIKEEVFWTVLQLHHPYPVDTGGQIGGDVSEKLKPLVQEMTEIQKLLPPAEAEVTKKQGELDTANQELTDARVRARAGEIEPDGPEMKAAQAKVATAQSALDSAKGVRDGLQARKTRCQNAMNALLKEAKELMEDLKNWDTRFFGTPPLTELEESKGFQTWGWCYFRMAGRIISIITGVIKDIVDGRTGDILDSITSRMVVPTRLFHFAEGMPEFWPAGRANYETDLIFRNRPEGFKGKDAFGTDKQDYHCWKGTWNVPPGRALKLRGNWLFEGDLWLRRGSLLVVEGSLLLENPLVWEGFGDRIIGPNSAYKPTGRLVIEEGAILVVRGNFEAEGTQVDGSIAVVGQYGDPGMITSAVLCSGKVDLKYGVHSSVLMDDMMGYLGSKGNAKLERLANGLERAISRAAGNLARIPWIGPFAARECWFADYATTFEVVPWLVEAGLGGPWPIPLPHGNCLKFPMWVLSWTYAIDLAATLGEYHVTMAAKIWPWGKGMVPAMVKIAPDQINSILERLNIDQLDRLTVDENIKDAFANKLPQFAGYLVKTVLFSALRSLLNPLNGGCSVEDLPHHLGEAKNLLKGLWALREQVVQVFNIIFAAGSEMQARIKDRIVNEFTKGINARLPVREVSGLLLYSGKDLEIGSKSQPDKPLMACGMFVAEHELDIQAGITVGTLMSMEGNIEARKLYHFPYFSRASLYRPKFIDTGWFDMVHFALPQGTEPPLPVGRPIYTATARGWERER